MRITLITKRRYTSKDIILDRYGRLYELPRQLALRGYEIEAWCIDYHSKQGIESWHHSAGPHGIKWNSLSIRGTALTSLITYHFSLLSQTEKFKPDLIIGASDIPHIALATWLSKKTNIPLILDFYDNFSSFGQARIPGFLTLLERCIGHAGAITTASSALSVKIKKDYSPSCSITTIQNGVDTNIFHPENKRAAREKLKLPLNATLIGTAGALSNMKGFSVVREAWQLLEVTYPEVQLVLAGKSDIEFPLPQGKRIHYFGELNANLVATLFQALDLGIISIADSAFGRYCFPQKLYEMLACKLPVVAANIGDTGELFKGMNNVLFTPDDAQDLYATIREQLISPTQINLPIPTWEHLSKTLEDIICSLAKKNSNIHSRD